MLKGWMMKKKKNSSTTTTMNNNSRIMTNKPFYESLVPTTLLLADKYWTQQMPEADKIMAIGMGGSC